MNKEDQSGNESEIQRAIRTEHFWHTATMIGLNAFLLVHVSLLAVIASVELSFYAVALIGNRCRKYYNQQYRKPVYRDFIPNLLIVIKEGEGSLFYVMLVMTACGGVVLTFIESLGCNCP